MRCSPSTRRHMENQRKANYVATLRGNPQEDQRAIWPHPFLSRTLLRRTSAAHFLETVPNREIKLVLIAPATETTTAIDSFFKFLHLNNSIRKEFDELILEKGGKQPAEYSIRRAMEHIQGSVLWIHDEEDQMTPLSDALKIKEADHNNIEFMITKGFGHRRIYRENVVMKRILDFL